MKNVTSIILVLFLIFPSIESCKSNSSSPEIQKDSKKSNIVNSTKTANQIYSEGMGILQERLSIQSSNTAKATELNEQAIKKFSEAHELDTSYKEPIMFASECTMFARDYKECIFWTTKLRRIDTSSSNLAFWTDRLKYCTKKLKSKIEN